MTDLSLTIRPKSDQLNADDLIAGPLTLRITKVSANPESAEQPVSIFFEGDGDKPYRPCKSMRRVLVHVWGKDGTTYPGRSLVVYRDPKVQFGGLAVGGIRISHMSHITDDVTMALTETRAKRKPYTVRPLVEEAKPTQAQLDEEMLARFEASMGKFKTAEQVTKLKNHHEMQHLRDRLNDAGRTRFDAAVAAAEASTAPAPADAAAEVEWPSAEAAE